jgi:YtcA family
MGSQINVIGSFFPSWMLCALIGIVTSLLARRLFVRAGLDAHMGPPPLIYASLTLLVTLVLWLWAFRG